MCSSSQVHGILHKQSLAKICLSKYRYSEGLFLLGIILVGCKKHAHLTERYGGDFGTHGSKLGYIGRTVS